MKDESEGRAAWSTAEESGNIGRGGESNSGMRSLVALAVLSGSAMAQPVQRQDGCLSPAPAEGRQVAQSAELAKAPPIDLAPEPPSVLFEELHARIDQVARGASRTELLRFVLKAERELPFVYPHEREDLAAGQRAIERGAQAVYQRLAEVMAPIEAEMRSARGIGPVHTADRPTRVALLPMGWGAGATPVALGAIVTVEEYRQAFDLAAADGADVVVLLADGLPALWGAAPAFAEAWADAGERFETVAWVRYGVGLGQTLSVYTSKHIVMRPEGGLGAEAGWVEFALVTPSMSAFEQAQAEARRVAARSGRDPALFSAMQCSLDKGYTIDVDESGLSAKLREGVDGDVHIRGGVGAVLRAHSAVAVGLARGVADTREELLSVLGLAEVEWVGEDAAQFLHQTARRRVAAIAEAERALRQFYQAISALRGPGATEEHRAAARAAYAALERILAAEPSIGLLLSLSEEDLRSLQAQLDRALARKT